ncbi:MAG TPA: hypothetical protein PKW90_28970, partial [Myxococcota bacterium]|nr:hypothetical protein [Myxococcota bacterium]
GEAEAAEHAATPLTLAVAVVVHAHHLQLPAPLWRLASALESAVEALEVEPDQAAGLGAQAFLAVFMHMAAVEVIWAMRAVEADQWVLGQVRAAPIKEVRRPIHLPQL